MHFLLGDGENRDREYLKGHVTSLIIEEESLKRPEEGECRCENINRSRAY